MFRFSIRDVQWLTAVVALLLGWGADRRSFIASYQRLNDSYQKQLRDYASDYAKQRGDLYQESRLIKAEYEAKYRAAINREEELKTTVRALKLRLGEDPYGK